MTGLLEAVLVLALLLVAAALAWDLAGPWRARRRGREHLDQLADEPSPEEPPGPRPLQALARRLRTAGLPFGPLAVVAIVVVLAACAVVTVLSMVPAIPMLAVVAGAVTAYVLWAAIREWARVRARRFERRLVDAVDFMVSALMAGENPTQSLSSAASTSEGAVRRELEEVVDRLELGLGIRVAVERMGERYDSEGVRLFTQTLIIKWQAGGDLAPVLRKVAWIMRERVRMAMRLRTELTGVQLAGLAVALMPYVLIPVYFYVRPEWSGLLINDPLGPPMIATAVILQVLGLLWLRRILAVEL